MIKQDFSEQAKGFNLGKARNVMKSAKTKGKDNGVTVRELSVEVKMEIHAYSFLFWLLQTEESKGIPDILANANCKDYLQSVGDIAQINGAVAIQFKDKKESVMLEFTKGEFGYLKRLFSAKIQKGIPNEFTKGAAELLRLEQFEGMS